ncbi:MAG TPA: hypothetical protein VII31_11990 [Caldimonas sp.]
MKPLLEAPAAHSPELEARLTAVETRLVSLGNALRARDPVGIDLHAAELHRALASAVSQFSDAARSGPLPPALRSRLATASGQVAAQRESLARATAALDRAIDVLLPRESLQIYSALGAADRGMFKSGVIRA